MIDIRNLSIQFTGENLFENLNLKINRHDKISLVGSNGKGKSTLLKLIIGIEKPESGEIIKQKGLRIGYLPQEMLVFKGKTLFDEVKSSLVELKTIVQREKEIIDLLNIKSLNGEERDLLLEELGEINHKKEEIDFYSAESRIEKVLTGLGFNENDFYRLTDEFSGGWQMRIQLAKILLADNHLILLDEPTNHLDIDTLTWLVGFLQNYEGALIIVSHDRHFVNNVTNKTLEIFNYQVNYYPGTYEEYLTFKRERDIQLRNQEKIREKKVKEVERFIERFRYKASKAKQVQSRIKQLEKLDSIELIEDEKRIDIRFPDPPKSGVLPVELISVEKSYGSLLVFQEISVQIERGDKIAIVGPNGAGKTTLAKIIGRRTEINKGEINYGHNTIVSYYEQEVAESLNPDYDLIDILEDVNEELTIGELRKILGSFLFTGDDVFKKVKVLSGGEKSRVALSRLLLTKSNLIILDEPTNHLDFTSKEILQKALNDFSGTLIIVSHDIEFLRPIVNKVFEIRDNKLKIHYGGIDYYLNKRLELSDNKHREEITGEKQSKKDRKRLEAELRQKKFNETKAMRTRLEICESAIQSLEELKNTIEKELSDPNIFSNPIIAKEKNQKYESTKISLEKEYEIWTELSHQIEEIEKNYTLPSED